MSNLDGGNTKNTQAKGKEGEATAAANISSMNVNMRLEDGQMLNLPPEIITDDNETPHII